MAVYTEVADDALAAFLAEYDIGEAIACKGIAEGVENSNFSLRTSAGDYILTLYERRVDVAELPWFLALMRHLSGRGIACPLPVPGRDGEALRTLCGRAAAITTFLPGVSPRRIRLDHCAPVGAALAALHRAGADFSPQRRNTLGPDDWPALLDRSRAHPEAGTLASGLLDELAASLARIRAAWPAAGLPCGHIHADLFPDNVFFLRNALSGVIDFYFAATDLLAYDLAICLNAWCFEPDLSFNVTRSRAMVAAYDRGRTLSPPERAALPALCAGAALRFALTRLYDWLATPPGALVVRKDPMDYVRRLRFHLQATGASAYGL
jgi:homoserine kinase type II